jgi:transcriptional antiterminator NusG
MARQWFVIHTQTGYEEKVKTSLENKIKGAEDDAISQVLMPTEKVSEVKSGKKRVFQRKFFPGYILVEMEMNEKTWYLIKNIPGVSGFIGSGSKPIPLSEGEIKNILAQTKEKQEKPTPKIIFETGESVRVTEGPFVNFNGTIDEVNPDKGKIKVMVPIFGRTTPVELEYWQVERL